jgi:hypothetical protein
MRLKFDPDPIVIVPLTITPKGDMTIPQTPISVSERRLAIARTLYQALVEQDPDRAITLCDSSGRVVTHHYPQPEQSSSETAS